MKPTKTIIDAAILSAQRHEVGRFKVGAVIYDKRRLISFGTNHLERSVRSYNRKYVQFEGKIHAEVMSIINAKTDLQGYSIVVVRVNKKGQLRMSKPCEFCMGYIHSVGIRTKDIYYSSSSGEIVKHPASR